MILNDSTQDPKLRLPFDAQRYIIAKLFHCWPDMCFDVSVCKLVIILPISVCAFHPRILFLKPTSHRFCCRFVQPVASSSSCSTYWIEQSLYSTLFPYRMHGKRILHRRTYLRFNVFHSI